MPLCQWGEGRPRPSLFKPSPPFPHPQIDPREVNPWQQQLYITNSGDTLAWAELDGVPLARQG